MLRRSDANEEGTRGERGCRNKTTEGKMKASGACCAALKMSIIDPRKGNEIQRPNIKKKFSSRSDFFCAIPSVRLPSSSSSPSPFANSAIHHIQLPRLFNQKSPFFFGKISKKSDCVLTPKSPASGAEAEKRPPARRKMPNHHLGCGYVDAWSRVMLLQFPSGRGGFFLLSSLFSLALSGRLREEENCVYFGHSLDISASCTPSFSSLRLPSPSQNVFFLLAFWTGGEAARGIMEKGGRRDRQVTAHCRFMSGEKVENAAAR